MDMSCVSARQKALDQHPHRKAACLGAVRLVYTAPLQVFMKKLINGALGQRVCLAARTQDEPSRTSNLDRRIGDRNAQIEEQKFRQKAVQNYRYG